MKQDRISEITRKAIEVPMGFTQSLMEKTEKVKTPSPRVDKIGRSIGACVGVLLLLTGGAGLLVGKSSWAIGSLSVGAVTILSNFICIGKNKK
ncbi:hypothetical protein SAMN02746066_02246 [Anaerosporobacter mobilis DSM 15930]|jgi:3-dehydroquinate synthase class II|uniref:Uncharacterized protein n=1 Tax=Anaerosporobacter mobilis DSM 15930 TaxID=1120996 RepID=A0A1M7JFU5_9FIRM|nr:hypothetical protein [Anaerosporobacter mobilis]SHM51818.1 hypothetical protein SAMN02746066_02246 [Anaerosporobacter mobilis DSM 15930]